MNVGFIGLGVMGRPMAGHVLDRGHKLWVHNRSKAAIERLAAQGATPADPAAMTKSCDVILLCLPTSVEVAEVTQRLLLSARPGLTVVDHSTIQPRVAQRLAVDSAGRGVAFLDAPITGGSTGAQQGTLTTMVGGDAAALERVMPVLEAYSKKVVHVGRSGNGQMTKLANQVLCAVNLMAAAEALSFVQETCLDLDKTLEVLTSGAGDSWQLRSLGPKMIAGDFAPGFSTKLQAKDLVYAEEAAQLAGTPLFGTPLALQLLGSLIKQGRGGDSTAAIFDVFRQLNGHPDGAE